MSYTTDNPFELCPWQATLVSSSRDDREVLPIAGLKIPPTKQ